MKEAQSISPSGDAEATAISWTGGKDCNLALLSAWRDPTLNVTTLVVFAPKSGDGGSGFHAHPIRLMEAQAEALGLALRIMSLPAGLPYKEGYVNAIRQLRDEHGIRVLGTGDMDLVGSMSTNWIDDCCQEVGSIRSFLPLWKADRITCLDTLVSEDFVVIFSCVKQPWFSKAWVGRRIDVEAIKEMKQQSTDSGAIAHDNSCSPEGQKLDIGGENGEYHTMCLGGPMYSRIIELEKTEPKEFQSEPAKEGVHRWWTYDGQTWWTIGEVKIQ
mmetsp:Transcript_20554/g.58970  ORF Transcript_20554/g.58970 Transcript_20554/m.58970 type:complete len:272 (+) Transcript_20554:132-947(+)